MQALTERLKELQTAVKGLNVKREQLLGDIGRQEQTVSEAATRLKAMGVDGAEKLSIAELDALEKKTQALLDIEMTKLSGEVTNAENAFKNYQSALNGGNDEEIDD